MREAAVRGAALTVIAVVPTMASAWTGDPVRMAEGEEAVQHARRAANDAVAKSAAEIGESQPASVQVKASSGLPAQALIEASQDADLVVVGSRGVGGFTSLLLGSISNQVAHHAACPVVIVPSRR
jgi:nucleotide-binding universal stress UspA family protein